MMQAKQLVGTVRSVRKGGESRAFRSVLMLVVIAAVAVAAIMLDGTSGFRRRCCGWTTDCTPMTTMTTTKATSAFNSCHHRDRKPRIFAVAAAVSAATVTTPKTTSSRRTLALSMKGRSSDDQVGGGDGGSEKGSETNKVAASSSSVGPTKATPTNKPEIQSSPQQEQFDNYHLLWSPGVWKKIATSTAILGGMHALQLLQPIGRFLSQSFLSYDVLLPLAASACCLLQLLLNLVAAGCAGFNTYLGPVRPYFISLLFYLTVTDGIRQLLPYPPHPTRLTRYLVKAGARWFVALLPEMVHLWNDWYYHRRRSPQQDVSQLAVVTDVRSSVQLEDHREAQVCDLKAVGPTKSGFDAKRPVPDQFQGEHQMKVLLDIPTMGCVACINTIDRSLKQTSDRILQASSYLNPLGMKGGKAEILVSVPTGKAQSKQQQQQELVDQLVQAVHRAGFGDGLSVESIRVLSSTNPSATGKDKA